MSLSRALNADIDGLAAIAVAAGAVLGIVLFAAFGVILAVSFFLVATHLIEFFGFGRGRDGIRDQRNHSLNIRHGLGDNVLGQSIGNNGGRCGCYLHRLTPYAKQQGDYTSPVINKPLIISCNLYKWLQTIKKLAFCFQ